MKLPTEKELIEGMVLEAYVELKKAKIMDKMMKRHPITGLNNSQQLMMGANQKKIKGLGDTIVDLLAMHKEANDVAPEIAKIMEGVLD